MFRKVLIANRGEIAVRVIRACREMSIPTVAVYSDTDRTALHVQMADEAVHLGPSPPLESYLKMESILSAAKQTGAEAIHPGYGFLSENHRFAAICRDAGIVFIGPSPEAIELVGDKVASRKALSHIGVPMIPGMESASDDLEIYKREAEMIGYPVMVKAAAGGGGKGMRVVHDPQTLESAVESGRREAQSAFGDPTVYLEKCIESPRHIEFQVLADTHGNAIHVFERECSIQRRHQKIVEETPSTFLDNDLRERMGRSALDVVHATGYTNAGTVEFLVDGQKQYYFLEVNARIQVEHPVTEMVAGIDQVKWQIRIAAGESLTIAQKDLRQRGHAIECRIYAEDPANSFLPSLGQIRVLREPRGPGVRLDSGIFEGCDVSRHYDPVLAKLICWGDDRESARRRMLHALSEYVILGIRTPIPFLRDIMMNSAFIAGNTTTDFITQHMKGWAQSLDPDDLRLALAAAALCDCDGPVSHAGRSNRTYSTPWQSMGGWRIGSR